jgi:hypothetical protein
MMGKAISLFGLYLSLACVGVVAAPTQAGAITAELANTCGAMASKAFPRKAPGSATGNARAQRAYFAQCVANNGVMPADRAQKQQTAPAPK